MSALSPVLSPPFGAPSPSSPFSTSDSARPTPREALEVYKHKTTDRVIIMFKATGNAPILKQNFFKIAASSRFAAVISFLRKQLGWKESDALFLYINSSFAPAPDVTVANLFKCFGTGEGNDGKLIVNYSSTQAWG